MANIVTDPFTAADATDIGGRVPPVSPGGAAWAERVGAWTIQGNKAACTSIQRGHATIETGEADVVIQAIGSSHGGSTGFNNATGVVARWTATTDYWLAGFTQAGDEFFIAERNANVVTMRATATVVLGDEDHTVTLTAEAAALEAKLDGANTLTYGSATHNQAATQHGMMLRVNTDRMDDFTVDSIAVESIEIALPPLTIPIELVAPSIEVGLSFTLAPLTIPIVLIPPTITVGGGGAADAVEQRYYLYVADDASQWAVKVDRTWGEDPDSGAADWIPGTPTMTKRSNVQARRIVLQDPVSGRWTTRVVFRPDAVAWVTPGFTTQIPVRGASGLVTVQLVERRPEWIPRPHAIHHKPEPTTT